MNESNDLATVGVSKPKSKTFSFLGNMRNRSFNRKPEKEPTRVMERKNTSPKVFARVFAPIERSRTSTHEAAESLGNPNKAYKMYATYKTKAHILREVIR